MKATKVRLSQQEIDQLKTATKESFGEDAEIWLFGSRADPHKHGGDIDLYIETSMTTGIFNAKLLFRNLIWPVFGEQKIDLVVHSRSLKPNPFHVLAKQTGVKLSNIT